MGKHFVNIVVITAIASVIIRLIVANAGVTAEKLGLRIAA